MIGVIDVGGGLRGIYGAGIFDRCLEDNIHFDYCIGVSAGSANISSYLSGQSGRNYVFYHDYPSRKEYMSLSSLLKTGSFLNIEYVYGTLSNEGGENPLDFEKMMKNPAVFKIVATDAESGKSVYFDKSDFAKNDYFPLKASSSLPLVSVPAKRDGKLYFDGGISDGIPIEKAFADGCDKAVLILTHPIDYVRKYSPDLRITHRLIKRKFPNTALSISKIDEGYNETIKNALQYEKEGRLLILAPKNTCGLKTLSKNKEKLDTLYKMGFEDAEKIKDFIE